MLKYPKGIQRITPQFEATEIKDPGEVSLHFDLCFTHHDDFSALYKAHKPIISRCLSYGDLLWYKQNPNNISESWSLKGLRILGLASAGYNKHGIFVCPFLETFDPSRPEVSWEEFDRLEPYEVTASRI